MLAKGSQERHELLGDIRDMARRIGYSEYSVHVLNVRIHDYPITKLRAIHTEFLNAILNNRPLNEKELFIYYHRKKRPVVIENKASWRE